jgi:hypothetical protein
VAGADTGSPGAGGRRSPAGRLPVLPGRDHGTRSSSDRRGGGHLASGIRRRGTAHRHTARPGRAAAASLGLATGLPFDDGGISARLIGYGGLWLAALTTLIMTDAAGTSVLPSAYQRGDVLTAAGTATIMTNAVPITARLVPFSQRLPHGIRAVLQLAAFACLMASAVGRQQTPRSEPH